MGERFRLLKPIRNAVAAVAISFAPSTAVYAENYTSDELEENRIVLQEAEIDRDQSILEQLDELVEEDYGKAFVYSLLGFSLLNAAYRIQKGLELDTNRQFGLNILSSASFIVLASNLVVQTETDIEPVVTASNLALFSAASAAYSVDTMWQSDRSLRKRIPSIGAACAFLATSAVIFANTIDKT